MRFSYIFHSLSVALILFVAPSALAIDDQDTLAAGLDVIGGLLRDGDCTVIAWWTIGVNDGNRIDTISGTFDFLTTFPPDAKPFTLSLHDITRINSTSLDELLDTPPLASLVFDPSAAHPNCATLNDVGIPDCPFASPQIVPTLGEWGVITLGLILIIFGTIHMRQNSDTILAR